jgi:neutral ceramidase
VKCKHWSSTTSGTRKGKLSVIARLIVIEETSMRAPVMIVFAMFAVGPFSPASADPPRVGASSVKITPEPKTPMAGYYSPRAAEGVHDDLFAKAIVIESNGQKAALVALDLISTTRDMVEDARRLIERETGIPAGSVMISATHAHTGPVLAGRGARDDALGGSSALSKKFRDELPARITQAVSDANQALRPAKIRVGHGHEESIAFNRRFHMKDGTVGWNPGKLNPKIVKPAGAIDPDVPVVDFASMDGKPIATYVNYAVHLDNVGGLLFSADMPYTLSKSIAEARGPGALTMFTAGCCGDINHIDVTWAEPQHGFENAARMGVILAGEVLRTWPKLTVVNSESLRASRETVSLALPELKPGDLEKAREIAERHQAALKSGAPTFLETVWAYKVLDITARDGKPIEVEVQVIALGDELAWVSLPGEIFVELGLRIKQDSPFRHTIVAELANGAIGYIPSRRAYAQGNYEVVSARCAEGSGEKLTDVAVRLLLEMKNQP